MAFLDNSGDIILDAVLTDTGRLRLAQGDGSFKISKFALGDDEINYTLYNKNHSSGSAYYDLEILQTPILEAFTNNSTQIKSRLMTISRTNILFMPILKLNTNSDPANGDYQVGDSRFFFRNGADLGGLTEGNVAKNRFYVATDLLTFNAIAYARQGTTNNTFSNLISNNNAACLAGFNNSHRGHIRVDQGLDTEEIHPTVNLDDSLVETAFLVETDYRLGGIKSPTENNLAAVNFIDDDGIASYYLTQQGIYINPTNVAPSANKGKIGEANYDERNDPQVFSGPRGNTLQFRIQASTELQSSTYLFTQLGSSVTIEDDGSDTILGLDAQDPYIAGKTTIHYIDSTVRVIGANTGFRIDIPIRYVKIA